MIVRCSKCQDVLYDDGEKIPTLMLACPNCSRPVEAKAEAGELRKAVASALMRLDNLMNYDYPTTFYLNRADTVIAYLPDRPAPAASTDGLQEKGRHAD